MGFRELEDVFKSKKLVCFRFFKLRTAAGSLRSMQIVPNNRTDHLSENEKKNTPT